MSNEGWICPLCRCGVAPSELRCPCAGPVNVKVDPRIGSPYPNTPPTSADSDMRDFHFTGLNPGYKGEFTGWDK
jgi:hypothetical protein